MMKAQGSLLERTTLYESAQELIKEKESLLERTRVF